MLPIIFDFGTIDLFGLIVPLKIYTYGSLMALAFLMGMGLSARLGKRVGINPEFIYDLGLYILLGALAGARLFYILFVNPEYYLENPLHILYLNRGGLVFYGGFLAAIPIAIFFCRRHRVPLLKLADVVIPSLALGHAIGRLGCLAYGCCYGKYWPGGICFPAESPAYMDHLHRGWIAFVDKFSIPVFPTQLVESFANILIFSILLLLFFRKSYDGQVLFRYLLLYPPARFVIEFFRGDNRGSLWLELSHSQWISVIIFFVGLNIVITRSLQRRNAKRKKIKPGNYKKNKTSNQ